MWLTVAAAGFFGIIVLVTLLRAEKSVANGALTVITLVAIGVAVAATIRDSDRRSAQVEIRPVPAPALPALSCIDEMAGEVVLAACEKAVFASAESTAAAVSYTGALITRLTALGDFAAADQNATPELKALRRALERDRYGLVAQVLVARDNCSPTDCAAFRALGDKQQVVTNMDAHVYDGLVARYSASWNAPAPLPPGALAGLPPSVPTGKPTNAEFPSASSTPAVSIMNPEPGTGSAVGSTTRQTAAPAAGASAPKPAAASPQSLVPAPKPAAASAQASVPPPAKKPAAKPAHPPAAAPVQIAPPQPAAAASE